MPGTWGSMRFPPEIEENFEDKNKKLGEGMLFVLVFSSHCIVLEVKYIILGIAVSFHDFCVENDR